MARLSSAMTHRRGSNTASWRVRIHVINAVKSSRHPTAARAAARLQSGSEQTVSSSTSIPREGEGVGGTIQRALKDKAGGPYSE